MRGSAKYTLHCLSRAFGRATSAIRAQEHTMSLFNRNERSQARKWVLRAYRTIRFFSRAIGRCSEKFIERCDFCEIFILSDGKNVMMPDMTGWTYKDVKIFCELSGILFEASGQGTVSEQSIASGQSVDSKTKIVVKLA